MYFRYLCDIYFRYSCDICILSVFVWLVYKWNSLRRVQLFCDSMDCFPPGSSVHGILHAGILEWVAIFLLQGIFQTQRLNLSLLHCKQTRYHLSHQGRPIYNIKIIPPSFFLTSVGLKIDFTEDLLILLFCLPLGPQLSTFDSFIWDEAQMQARVQFGVFNLEGVDCLVHCTMLTSIPGLY